MKKYFALYLLTWVGSIFANGDSPHEIFEENGALLSTFFRSLITHTEAGYVLYDKKPVCMVSFCQNLCPSKPYDWHQISCTLLAGKSFLNEPSFRSGNIIFHIDEEERIFLVVNKKLFLSTVRANLPLFQYVLGPEVTPESLLDVLISGKKSFMPLFNYDKVLVGIVLGYGTQNSIYHARLENISDALFSHDTPPFRPVAHLCSDSIEKQMLLFLGEALPEVVRKNRNYLLPSFGFSSISDERKKLSQKIGPPSEPLISESPCFLFGCVSSQPTNCEKVEKLEATQKKIQELMDSSTFLTDVLEIIIEKRIEFSQEKVPSFSSPKVDINLIIAKVLKNELKEYDSQHMSSFLDGLQKCEGADQSSIPDYELAGFPESIESIRQARACLKEADLFFQNLHKDTTLTPILDFALYYKTIGVGKGPALDMETQLSVDVEIFDPSGKCLVSESNLKLDLCDTIPGFAHGLKGMQAGERREIHIHPTLAYGVHTYLGKGIYLKAVVRLIEINGSQGNLPSLVPMDVSFIRSGQFEEECMKEHKNTLRYLGKAKGQFLKMCSGVDVSEVVSNFRVIGDENVLSSEESKALNAMIWNAFFEHNL